MGGIGGFVGELCLCGGGVGGNGWLGRLNEGGWSGSGLCR